MFEVLGVFLVKSMYIIDSIDILYQIIFSKYFLITCFYHLKRINYIQLGMDYLLNLNCKS